MHRLISFSVLCLSLALTVTEAAAAIENPAKHAVEQSGLPLSYFCTHAPDLSVKRSDAVGDWLKICTLYFSQPQPHNPPGEAPGARTGQPPPKQ